LFIIFVLEVLREKVSDTAMMQFHKARNGVHIHIGNGCLYLPVPFKKNIFCYAQAFFCPCQISLYDIGLGNVGKAFHLLINSPWSLAFHLNDFDLSVQ
jgi:hypothetical protein